MKKFKNKNELLEWIKALGIALIFVLCMHTFILTPVVVKGASMMPTFEEGDRVVVNKIGPRLTNYNRFDVVVLDAKEDKSFIKRIIGMPGDQISYENDVLFVNGKRYEEPYLEEYKKALKDNRTLTEDFTLEECLGEAVVPNGHYFVLGDNRQVSKDSRDPSVGFVSKNKIVGKAKIVFYPLDNLHVID